MRGPHTTPCIVEQVDRGVRSLAPAFAELGVATVHESQGRGGLMDAAIKPLVVGARAAGPAVTCLNQPGDNLMLLAAMDLCQEGDVLVVANLAPSAMGMVGEIIASILIARGVAGLVVDAACAGHPRAAPAATAGLVEDCLGRGHHQGRTGLGERASGGGRGHRQPGRHGRRRRRRGRGGPA